MPGERSFSGRSLWGSTRSIFCTAARGLLLRLPARRSLPNMTLFTNIFFVSPGTSLINMYPLRRRLPDSFLAAALIMAATTPR